MLGGSWDEVILPGAITQDTIKRSVVLALMNHDESRGALARSKHGEGSLKLSVDSVGLKFAFEAPKTALGNELIEAINRGDIDSCSFAFSVEEERWEEVSRGRYRRYIVKIGQLFDVSPVYNPAYDSTSISERSNKRNAEVKKNLDAWREKFK